MSSGGEVGRDGGAAGHVNALDHDVGLGVHGLVGAVDGAVRGPERLAVSQLERASLDPAEVIVDVVDGGLGGLVALR